MIQFLSIQLISIFSFLWRDKRKHKEHNPKWSQLPDYLYRIFIIGGSGSGKTNSLFNLISQHPDIDKIHLYAKDPYETKYQFLINKRERTGLKHLNDSKAFIENSTYRNGEEYNTYVFISIFTNVML